MLKLRSRGKPSLIIPDALRRKFLLSASAASALSVMGCSTGPIVGKAEYCPDPKEDGPLLVDMHCHIMNLQDADRSEFLNRRLLNTDETTLPLWRNLVEAGERVLSTPAMLFTTQARAERAEFRGQFAKMKNSYDDFCTIAANKQRGIYFAQVDKQVTGFFSNRTRNVARLMENYPEVDLFTPSIVDFYEGDPEQYSSLLEQMLLYSAVAVATRGRFLPMIAFHPGRSYSQDSSTGSQEFSFRLQLKTIEFAIENLGFVGVKVHPSSGFAPIRNNENGCSNNERQAGKVLSEDEAKHFDSAMTALFCLCRRCDVPILTHSGTGLSANSGCFDDREPNAPKHWIEAIRHANALTHDYMGRSIPSKNKLRVCLAHFAGGFDDKRIQPTEWLSQAAKAMNEYEGLYLDLSAMSEWFTRDKSSISPRYENAFKEFFKERRKIAGQLMYGSDWHMPGVAKIGSNYLSGMQSLIAEAFGADSQEYTRTMGLNAAKFLKLRKDDMQRGRIDAFLAEHGIKKDDLRVGWRTKVDRIFSQPDDSKGTASNFVAPGA